MSSLMSSPSIPCKPEGDCTSIPRSRDASLCDIHDAVQKTPSSLTPSQPQDLQIENSLLKEEISQLKQQVETILDHSIESDTRLLQFTNEVFVAKTPSATIDSMGPELTSITPTTPTMSNVGVQCDLSVDCQDQRCAENRSLIQRLKTTIEVLEADLLCLRTQVKVGESEWEREDARNREWIVHSNKTRLPLTTANRFEVLSPNNIEKHQVKEPIVVKEKSRRRKKKVNNRSPPSYKKILNNSNECKQNNRSTPLKMRSINIESDSHGRGLAGLIGELMGTGTKVSATVRPGAKLRSVISYPTPSPDSCIVLIAGTNDMAAGEHYTIYRYLQQHILDKPTSSKLVVATLPYRHDLPNGHPIHRETEYVNRYIQHLTMKFNYKGVEALDFNRIPRHLFTNHGMHLRLPGKRLLARLVVESITKLDGVATPSHPSMPQSSFSPSTALTSTTSAAAGTIYADSATVTSSEVTAVPPPDSSTPPGRPDDVELAMQATSLPHDTFANAVKKTPEPTCDFAVKTLSDSCRNSNFLEIGLVKGIEH